MSKFAFVASLYLTLLGCLSAHAQSINPPTADAVLAEAKAASGGSAWDAVTSLRSTSTISQGGLNGTADEIDDILTGRSVVRYTLGPITGGNGFDGKVAWAQDQDGRPHTMTSAEDLKTAITNAYIVSMAYWYPERQQGAQITWLRRESEGTRAFDVLHFTPAGGFPFDMWVDSSTHMIDRIVEPLAEQTQTTYESDYRSVNGVSFPFTVRVTNGKPQYDESASVTHIDINPPVQDKEFAMPASRGSSFSFAGGAHQTTVPFQFKEAHIYFPLKLNGRTYSAIFDTGGAYVISPEVASSIGVKSQGALESTGGGANSVNTGFGHVADVQIGGLTLKNPLFGVIEIPAIRNNPIVGRELLQQLIVRIDYDKNTLTFIEPEAFSYKGHGTVVPFRYNGATPEVSGAVDGLPGVFTIDTGAGVSLEIYSPYVASHKLLAKYRPKYMVIAGYGVGGGDWGGLTRIHTLSLGGASVHNRLAFLLTSKQGGGSNNAVSGNVGEGVLHCFNLILDYGHQQIVFERNSHYDEPEVYTRAGMVLNPMTFPPKIDDVLPGGPADMADIQVGDIVLSVNGKPVQPGAFDSIYASQRAAPGTYMRLRIKSHATGAIRNVAIKLRTMI